MSTNDRRARRAARLLDSCVTLHIALNNLHDVCSRMDGERITDKPAPSEDEYQQAMAQALAALTKKPEDLT